MPYLPASAHDTPMTQQNFEVLRTYASMLIERFELYGTRHEYFQVDGLPTLGVDAGHTILSGQAGKSVFDVVTGEFVPVTAQGKMTQPHTDDSVDATASAKYKPPVTLPAILGLRNSNKPLRAEGATNNVGIAIDWPTPLLDKYGVVIRQGDEIVRNSLRYGCTEAHIPDRGYWKNTTIPLYIRAFYTQKSIGS